MTRARGVGFGPAPLFVLRWSMDIEVKFDGEEIIVTESPTSAEVAGAFTSQSAFQSQLASATHLIAALTQEAFNILTVGFLAESREFCRRGHYRSH